MSDDIVILIPLVLNNNNNDPTKLRNFQKSLFL